MWYQPENDAFADEIHLAGEHVGPGTYKQVGSDRTIRVINDDVLPASLDGRVACYVLVQTWAQVSQLWATIGSSPHAVQQPQASQR